MYSNTCFWSQRTVIIETKAGEIIVLVGAIEHIQPFAITEKNIFGTINASSLMYVGNWIAELLYPIDIQGGAY